MPPRLELSPPLLNSASPWATTAEHLHALYASAYTGGVTTRTTSLHGFAHDPSVHQHILFGNSSLNTYGYSPHALDYYLTAIRDILLGDTPQPPSLSPRVRGQTKPFIISLAGTPSDVAECIRQISDFAGTYGASVAVELNLSCPNLPGAPPPAYDAVALAAHLAALPEPADLAASIPLGVKAAPFIYDAQVAAFVGALAPVASRLTFITAINTLGNALHLTGVPSLTADDDEDDEDGNAGADGRAAADAQISLRSSCNWMPTLSSASGTGAGGLAGEAIHCLALGNINALRRELDRVGDGLQDVMLLGVGGVGDRAAWERMLAAGASAVEVGTALGREGVNVFEKILKKKRTGDVGV